MENLATHEYNPGFDKEVRNELEIAKIPVVELPAFMNTEVKTQYIGMFKGWMFWRAWTYWVACGNLPLTLAKKLYDSNDKGLGIRAFGHCGNVDPLEYKNMCSKNSMVDVYHIDTQLGLCKFIEFLDINNC